MGLAEQTCVPCRGGVPPLESDKIAELLPQLTGWQAVDNHHLRKEYRFKNFVKALDFVNRVGALAEEQKHHPDVRLSYGEVVLEILTHKIDGLTESDFIFAAKCDALPRDEGARL
ncbi:MAG: 4a-hydroxytetrahydrobiopterin dehydratase [Candidatus Eremiobacter antarcticus]|nr:4a-hydroxytetrahydrobiopterin dehydratase [Candidatus Eremiobacteraeota bacterium]MBC5807003.1 4a-hydroxytetrahydrobiopterin dehydratase [Candidatus Eremiobacteraeota bacterium]